MSKLSLNALAACLAALYPLIACVARYLAMSPLERALAEPSAFCGQAFGASFTLFGHCPGCAAGLLGLGVIAAFWRRARQGIPARVAARN